MDNGVEQLAYESALRAIQDQASVLDGLRTRAGTVLAAAALVSSFLGGQALHDDVQLHFVSWTTVALGAFVVSALFTLAILWPFEFGFSVSANAMLRAADDHEKVEPTTIQDIYRVLALQLEWHYDSNARKIRWLLWAFALAIVFLVLEVAVWLVVLWRS